MNRNKKNSHKMTANVLGLTLASVMAAGTIADVSVPVFAAQQKQETEASKSIYLNGSAGSSSEKADGTTKEKAVASLSEALRLAGSQGTVYVCGTVTVCTQETITIPSGVSLQRCQGFTGAIVKITGDGRLTVTGNGLSAADVDTSGATGGSAAFQTGAEVKEEKKKTAEVSIPSQVVLNTLGEWDSFDFAAAGFSGNGTFAWQGQTPGAYETTVQAVFTPKDKEELDYTGVQGWDAASGTVVRTVKVLVEELKAPEQDQTSENSGTENQQGGSAPENGTETEDKEDSKENTEPSKPETEDKTDENKKDEDKKDEVTGDKEDGKENTESSKPETEDKTDENKKDEDKKDEVTGDKEDSKENTESSKPETEDKTDENKKDEVTGDKEDGKENTEPSKPETEDKTDEDKKDEDKKDEVAGDKEDGKENTESSKPETEDKKDEDKKDEATGDKKDEEAAGKDDSASGDKQENGVKIEYVDDTRENPEPEEKEEEEEITYSAQEGKHGEEASEIPEAVPVGSLIDESGVRVYGDFIPYYVDLQVTYNEAVNELPDAGIGEILSAYELKLWDLKENQEYQIPEGKKVKVMIPLPENANCFSQLSIAHYLGNNQYEYFVFGKDGKTGNMTIEEQEGKEYLTFETASFSPFNVGGHQIVGLGTDSSGHKTPDTGSSSSSAGTGTSSGSSSQSGQGSKTAGTQNQTQSNTGNSGAGNTNTKNVNTKNTGTKIIRTVKTGDETSILVYVAVGAGALLLAVIALVAGKKRKK